MTLKQGGLIAGLLAAMGLVMFGIMRVQDNSESSVEKLAATALQPVINISTETPDSLIFQMSAASVDICYSRSPLIANEVVFDSAFVAKMKALGFNRLLKYSDGAIANVNHIVLDSNGKGYNGLRSDFPSDAAFKDAMGGVLWQQNWKSDFFLKTTDLIRAIGVPDDVVLNPNDSWLQNKYRIENSQGEYVFLGSEEVTSNTPRTWTAGQYLSWAKPIVDSIKKYFPNKKIIADQGQLYTGAVSTLKWRRDITPTTLPGIYGTDCYLQVNDVMKFTFNMDSNAMKVTAFFDSIIPLQIDSFKRSFPGWKWVVGEIHIVDARVESEPYTPINRNMVGVFAWGKFYTMFITNQELIPAAIQMELKKYINPDENNTKIITMLNTLLKPGYNVTDLTLENMTGCSGASIRNITEPKKHAILITNESASTYTLPKVVIDGKNKSPNFTVTNISAPTWDGVVISDTTTAETITILPKSVSIISFTTGSSVPN